MIEWIECNTTPCPYWTEWVDEYNDDEKEGFCQTYQLMLNFSTKLSW